MLVPCQEWLVDIQWGYSMEYNRDERVDIVDLLFVGIVLLVTIFSNTWRTCYGRQPGHLLCFTSPTNWNGRVLTQTDRMLEVRQWRSFKHMHPTTSIHLRMSRLRGHIF
ncbi:hypothetical protein BAUCODRAFT_136903 [Baudoinia panamericana UAMH 10762]|uniref:Uncharacterized protein n=1 Tax=Baudoinia panamericana (strain UAMH 10762) TaxID=717646 RepID=M2MPH0_BAUPA|nr:uncharacterized protein BAUCODRAFT_136903 [Baudoinia panamericana UAMH 10762]EMC98636.1 hypothetical protein BAUCODRAFT_136903 [Baudoinia panamericana UAMH 10762]